MALRVLSWDWYLYQWHRQRDQETLSKFANDMKLSSAWHDRRMDASGRTWKNLRSKPVSLTKFSKCKVPHLSRGNPRCEYIVGKKVIESSPAVGHELRMCACSPDFQSHPGLHPEWHGQQWREMILPPYSALVRPHLE